MKADFIIPGNDTILRCREVSAACDEACCLVFGKEVISSLLACCRGLGVGVEWKMKRN